MESVVVRCMVGMYSQQQQQTTTLSPSWLLPYHSLSLSIVQLYLYQHTLMIRRRRADKVPWSFAQSTARNERLCALLSPLLLRQPAPPLRNRHAWQLFASTQRNVLLLVINEEPHGSGTTWPDNTFVQALQEQTRPSTFFFVWQLARGHKAAHFAQRWTRLMATLSPRTDVYVILGSHAALAQLSQLLLSDETPRTAPQRRIKGILSVLPHDNDNQSPRKTMDSLPNLPDEIFHWIIAVGSVPTQSFTPTIFYATQGHGQTVATLLSTTTTWPPPSWWLVRAAVWFASAVQTIHGDPPTARPRL